MTQETVSGRASPDTRRRPTRPHYPSDLVDFVQEASMAVVVLDRRGTIAWANRAAFEGLGFQRDDFLGKQAAGLFANPGEAEAILAAVFGGEVVNRREVLARAAAATYAL